MRNILNSCLKIVQYLLPASCLLCGAGTQSAAICEACDADQPRLPAPRCVVCALPLPAGDVCGACLARAPRFDAVCAAFAYAFPVDALIQALKYGNNLAVAVVLGEALAASVEGKRPDFLLPMPLSAARLRSRGFNQALEIARRVSALTGIPVVDDICSKTVDTLPQAGLPWKARARNVRGVFACHAGLEATTIAVVDDVMTTGATLDELARCLKRAGAAEVRGWVVARALKRRS